MNLKEFKHGGNIRELANSAGVAESELLDFSASINPLGPPEYLRAVLSAQVSRLRHYPDPDYSRFKGAAARSLKVAANQLVAGNGSTELIFALPRVLPVNRALVLAPAYIGYQEAMQAAALPVESLPLREELGFAVDWQELAAGLAGGELVFFGQPNNPTGTVIDLPALARTARKFPETFFVVDEAFADFIPQFTSAATLVLAGLANVIVLKSMTKFYAIPGLRLGLAVAAAELAARLQQQLPPWSVNSLALALGERFLEDRPYQAASVAAVGEWRQALASGLAAINGLKVFPGQANYLLVKLETDCLDAEALARHLLRQGMAIRVCDNFGGLDKRFFRIAVRNRVENERLIGAIARVLGARRPRPAPPRKTPALMFQGTCSDAGKSILTTALCRILLQDGVRVAPFKAQNMSLNSFVTRDGGEMGRAQVVQAQACRLDPEVRMNPVLLKPSSEVGSQVIVNGRPLGNMTVDQYVAYKPQAFEQVCAAYDSLAAEYDAVVLEGAGSPAEVNLKAHDIVNMRMARHAGAPVVLVGDIDRGGVFASFVGTMELMTEWERRLIAGFLVNRFRGQESLLNEALAYTLRHTGRPVLGVIPYLADLGLPEEDSVSFKKGLFQRRPPAGDHVVIALIDLPHISNFTDFEPFLAEPDVHLKVVKEPGQLQAVDAILLPGSKNVIKDLDYLHSTGLAEKIIALAGQEIEVIGICGGYQMLGREIADPYQVESGGARAGLGLLAIATVLAKDKTLTRTTMVHGASGLTVTGYEIHHGQTSGLAGSGPLPAAGTVGPAGSGNKVWGTYLHGLFDADPFRHWFIDQLRQRRGFKPAGAGRAVYDLEPALDRLAAMVRARLDLDVIYGLLGL